MKIARGLCIAIVTNLMVLAIGGPAAATEQVLYQFCHDSACTDGSQPQAGLLIDGVSKNCARRSAPPKPSGSRN